ncbi:hypothetical protein [Granulicella aggregans]|uniref:hypothetical protein n=1 Tax=Granulicella aggregans TaxID=474949 RepID=UPI0021DFD5E8|nr:hypothetical protein [Granulicella aggregans]
MTESSEQSTPPLAALTMSGHTPASPPASSSSPRWVGSLSIAKDVVGIIQNILAIGAIIAGGVWFWMQAPFSPVVVSTISTEVTPEAGQMHVNVIATFQNTGHVPFSYSCFGIDMQSTDDFYPPPDCTQAGVLKPGEQTVRGQLINIPENQISKDNYIHVKIGNLTRDKVWRTDAPGSVKYLVLTPLTPNPKAIDTPISTPTAKKPTLFAPKSTHRTSTIYRKTLTRPPKPESLMP